LKSITEFILNYERIFGEKKMKRRKRISLLSSSLILVSLVLLVLLTGCKVNSDKINQPSYSVNEGTYTAPITVEINKPDGTDISLYYTIDGTDPTVNATKYTGPIVLATNTTLKSIAIDKNSSSSEIKSAVYTISIPIENIPGITNPHLTNDSNDNEKSMNMIQGTWVATQEGWTLKYSFTPIDSMSGTLIYSEVGPNGNGDGYSADYTVTNTSGSDTATINMTNIQGGGITPANSVINIDYDSNDANQISINGILCVKN